MSLDDPAKGSVMASIREPVSADQENSPEGGWYFLSNHALVLLAAVRNPDATVRELAKAVGVTERTTFRVLSDLEAAGYMSREGGGGRGGRFIFREDVPLRHPLNRSIPIRQLIDLLETPDVATWRWTPSSNETELSERVSRLHGLEPGPDATSLEAIIGAAVYPADQAGVREAFERAASLGELDLTYRVRLSDGALRWIRARGQQQPINGRLIGTFTDITREMQLEATRFSSEARLQVIFAESETPMFVFGAGVRFDAVNEAFSRALGRDQSELLGTRLGDLVDPGDVATVRELTEQLGVDGGHVTVPEVTLLGKRRRQVRCSIRLWVDDGGDGEARAGVGVVHVSERGLGQPTERIA